MAASSPPLIAIQRRSSRSTHRMACPYGKHLCRASTLPVSRSIAMVRVSGNPELAPFAAARDSEGARRRHGRVDSTDWAHIRLPSIADPRSRRCCVCCRHRSLSGRCASEQGLDRRIRRLEHPTSATGHRGIKFQSIAVVDRRRVGLGIHRSPGRIDRLAGPQGAGERQHSDSEAVLGLSDARVDPAAHHQAIRRPTGRRRPRRWSRVPHRCHDRRV